MDPLLWQWRNRRRSRRCDPARGFTLVELLLTLGLASLLLAMALQLLVGDLRHVGRLGRWLRERQAGERTLELIRSELQRADQVSVSGDLPPGCGSPSRRLVLQLSGHTIGGSSATVIYSYGEAPSTIWRGAVLMRCGPAYGLDGSWSDGESTSRVLIDALPAEAGFAVLQPAPGLLRLRLARRLEDGQALEQTEIVLVGRE